MPVTDAQVQAFEIGALELTALRDAHAEARPIDLDILDR